MITVCPHCHATHEWFNESTGKMEPVPVGQVVPCACGRRIAVIASVLYICIGPFCWGRGSTQEQAIRNAKRGRIRQYEGHTGWCHIVFEVTGDPGAYVDGTGALVRHAEATVKEVARKNWPL